MEDNASYLDKIPIEVLQQISSDLAWGYQIVPVYKNEGSIKVISANRLKPISQELSIILGTEIEVEYVDTETIHKALIKCYPRQNFNGLNSKSVFNDNDLLNSIVRESKMLNSSDIHIETYEKRARIRLRIDGKMVEKYVLEKENYPALVNKVKILANLDISEKRLPQDGRIYFSSEEGKFDIRVSVLPTLHGEKIVLRLLNNSAENIEIGKLGFSPEDKEKYLEGVRRPNGIVLISGPTGSGKTTTLYATLKLLNKEVSNILTIEDPIEYTLEGINQVQLKENIGLTFANTLRTFLRQDPDIIMVGEIRDVETANMAIRAALTGHLVLSTIHTNSAWGTVSRLIDMGIAPFLLAGTLNLSVAQRLVRLLCPKCKLMEGPPSKQLFPKNFKLYRQLKNHYIANGCEHCQYTGYKGRKAIYEVIAIDSKLSDKIKSSELNVDALLNERKFISLSENAFELVEKGETTVDEIYPLLMNY